MPTKTSPNPPDLLPLFRGLPFLACPYPAHTHYRHAGPRGLPEGEEGRAAWWICAECRPAVAGMEAEIVEVQR